MSRQFLWLFGLCSIFILCQCTSKTTFTIDGDFSITDPTPIKLYLLTSDKPVLKDSAFVENSNFKLQGDAKHAGIYLLKFFNDQRIYLVIHPGDNIIVNIFNENNSIEYHIENSPDSKLIKELTDWQNHILRTIDQLSTEWEQARADTSKRKIIDSTYYSILREHKKATREFIYSHPKSLANIMAVYQNFGRKAQPLFDPYDDHDLFNFIDSNLVALYPNTAAVQALNTEVTDIKAQIKHKKYIDKIVEEGRHLPPFQYPNINGDSIIIEEPFTKPTILLFWASWNAISTQELLELNSHYLKYGARTANIVAISLDSSEELLNEFMIANNIKLPVVCDYLYWDSEIPARYAVKRIPSTIVANKEGVIVAQDVFAPELLNHIRK